MNRNPILDALATALSFVLLCIALAALYRVNTADPFHCNGTTGVYVTWWGSQQISPQDPECIDPDNPYGYYPEPTPSTT